MQGKMDCFGMTDRGQVRRRNEDQFLIADLNKSMRLHQSSLSIDNDETLFGGSQGQLLMVADGIGGQAGGDRASQFAVQAVATYVLNTMPWFFQLNSGSDEEYREELVAALKSCQQTISAESETHPEDAGMGTTLTMGYLIWPKMYVMHVGDSRCYLQRGEKLHQITRDHTVKQQLIDAGINEEVEDDCAEVWANTLWNSLSADSDTTPDVFRIDLRLGDTLLFCTDGLTKHVSDEKLREVLSGTEDAECVCRMLTQQANNEGGTDNITMVVARFLDSEEARAEDSTKAIASPPLTDEDLEGLSTIEQIRIPKELLDSSERGASPGIDEDQLPAAS